jgi:radical SAM superfamily enzyme YgiQ (UPF0313 family)
MSIRKFLLISANRHAIPYPVYPLGISYLFSYLRDRLPEHDIRIFDANLDTNDELIKIIHEFQPDYTGVSFRNVDDVNFYSQESFIHGYRVMLETIRQHSKNTIIIGGSAFSIYPEELFSFFNPDYGIFGEGEESLYRLILSLDSGIPDLSVEGLVYRDREKVIVNERKNYIKTPDLCFDKQLINYYWDKSGMMNIQTKRGCPYHCIYCTYPLIEGAKVRTLDPDKIVHTLKELNEKNQVDYAFFTDSVFNIHNPFNIELAEKIIKSGVNMKWGAYFSPHNLDAPLLELFHRAGLTHIEFGTESLSDSTLKNYGKIFTVDEIVEISRLCNDIGIYFAHFMILGGYGETEQTIDEGFENSKRIENTVFFPYIGMRIYPGTRLQELAIKEGMIHAEDNLLEPVYYVAKGINYESLKQKAEATGRRWVFPDEDVATIMNRMRKRKRKGSLWHHLKK